jgi:hypothetical protein
MYHMKPSLIAAVMAARFQSHLAGKLKRGMLITGLPGGGKTQITRQVAESLGVGFIAIHAPTMQPEDWGIPVLNQARDSVKFVVPCEKIPFEGDDNWPEHGIVLIDEISQLDNAQQKVVANLFQEREIHGRKVKAGWMFVCTGNPTTARAGANKLLSHLADRVTAYEFEIDMDDLCNWGLANDVAVEVISFWRFKPDLICDFDPHRDKNATPRGWVEGVSATLGNVPPEAEYETFKGDVGEGAAAVFKGYLNVFRKLPNPDAVIMAPMTAEVPDDPATLYALSGAIAHRASKANFDRVLQYANRMPPEFGVLVVRDSIKRCPDVQHTKAFITWASGPGAKILM